MIDLTWPLIIDYAKRVNSDYILIDHPHMNLKDVGFEKYYLGEIINEYDRILYLDIDIIVKPNCPNMFEVFSEIDNFYAFIEDQYFFVNPVVDRQESIQKSQEILGNIGWNFGYFNSGVMLFGKKHANLFDIPKKYVTDMREQTQLNYDCKRLGIWVNDIGLRYNKMDFINPLDRFDAHMIHYAGRGFTDKWNDLAAKVQQMKQDLNLLKLLPVKESIILTNNKPGSKSQILFQGKN